jgi:serine/threonine-protein kinase HipA
VKNTKGRQQLEVWADWHWLKREKKMGDLYATQVRGKDIFSFEYSPEWIKSSAAQILDPSLQLEKGLQYADPDRGNFGIFLDSSPDRWGRVLMQRRENLNAKIQKRMARKLSELEFLLGVNDLLRSGALRYKKTSAGPFLSDDTDTPIPHWLSLRQLEKACKEFEKQGEKTDSKWINLILAPGSSLGGARPKANVADEYGNIWIAKFPSRNDQYDSGAWEYLVHQLAARVGINVTDSQAGIFMGPQRTFLTKRFDRTIDGKRIHFSSAMNLLQRKDGDDYSNGASYLELVELIIQNSADPKKDLGQLWLRIVFSICVSNTDDHLRNHGFLLTPKGWRISPAYDMNPNPAGDGLKLNISETDNSQDFDLALSVADTFRIKTKDAKRIIAETISVVKTWPTLARKLKIHAGECEIMRQAFRLK